MSFETAGFNRHSILALNLVPPAGSAGNKTKTGSTKRPGQELERNTVAPAYMAQQQQHASTSTAAAAASMAAQPVGYSYEDVPRQPVPLKYVVQEAVKRWFEDTLQVRAVSMLDGGL